MKKSLLILIIVVLVVGVLYFWNHRYDESISFELFKIKELVNDPFCKLKGDEWVSCGDGRFGPCGCKKLYKDGGKICQGEKDCLAGFCTISTSDTPDINGIFVGRCPQSSFDTGCGYAWIENGKITKDWRNCLY